MSTSDDENLLDLNKMKINDLRKELHLRNLKVSGNKQDLIERLQQYLVEHEGIEIEEEEEILSDFVDANEDKKDENPKKESLAEDEVENSPDVAEEPAVKTVDLSKINSQMTEEQKKEERENKFGFKSDDEQRRHRFGKSSITDYKVEIDAEKMKKRAERFGSTLSKVLASDQEQMRKRKERFTQVIEGNKLQKLETDSKKQKRAERFGLVKA